MQCVWHERRIEEIQLGDGRRCTTFSFHGGEERQQKRQRQRDAKRFHTSIILFFVYFEFRLLFFSSYANPPGIINSFC